MSRSDFLFDQPSCKEGSYSKLTDLTPRNRVLEKLILAQLIKNFYDIYETR
jgi:hypothetical protein